MINYFIVFNLKLNVFLVKITYLEYDITDVVQNYNLICSIK